MIKTNLVAFLSGVLFSIGLGISGMTQPQKVIGFLDVFGEWDPSLIFVMVGGIISYLILQSAIQRRFSTPVLASMFKIPTRKKIDLNKNITKQINCQRGWNSCCTTITYSHQLL